MYKKVELTTCEAETFELSFEGKLDPDNRWILMAEIIPWSELEEEYAKKFTLTIGAPAKSARMALGALIIKEKLGISDRETVEQIRENPYLQYFIGLTKYSNQAPFEASMLVHFRQRLEIDLVNKINNKMCKESEEEAETEKKLLKAAKKKRM